eukprot:TRINITY_DN27379_c0_g2_i1.p1 TRINITY_DN27379_c0_g2~~TRINITY_DN27379_c0_g2_i1.p1  ORF type:complete len:757 (+),score=103.53 TRINITY_DN27379_c0_g2_i1:187-2457(+)
MSLLNDQIARLWELILAARTSLYHSRVSTAQVHLSVALDALNNILPTVTNKVVEYSVKSQGFGGAGLSDRFSDYTGKWVRIQAAIVTALNDRAMGHMLLKNYGCALRDLGLAQSTAHTTLNALTQINPQANIEDDIQASLRLSGDSQVMQDLATVTGKLTRDVKGEASSCCGGRGDPLFSDKIGDIWLGYRLNMLAIHLNMGDMHLIHKRYSSSLNHFQQAQNQINSIHVRFGNLVLDHEVEQEWHSQHSIGPDFIQKAWAVVLVRKARVFLHLSKLNQVNTRLMEGSKEALQKLLLNPLVGTNMTECLDLAKLILEPLGPPNKGTGGQGQLTNTVQSSDWLRGMFTPVSPASELESQFDFNCGLVPDGINVEHLFDEIRIIESRGEVRMASFCLGALGLTTSSLTTGIPPELQQSHRCSGLIRRSHQLLDSAAKRCAPSSMNTSCPAHQAVYSKASIWSHLLDKALVGADGPALVNSSGVFNSQLLGTHQTSDIETATLLICLLEPRPEQLVETAVQRYRLVGEPVDPELLGDFQWDPTRLTRVVEETVDSLGLLVSQLPNSWCRIDDLDSIQEACREMWNCFKNLLASDNVNWFGKSEDGFALFSSQHQNLLCTLPGMCWLHSVLMQVPELSVVGQTPKGVQLWEQLAEDIHTQTLAPFQSKKALDRASSAPNGAQVGVCHVLWHQLHLVMEGRVGSEVLISPETLKAVVSELHELVPHSMVSRMMLGLSEQDLIVPDLLQTCLLYTSPSPRDS